MLRPGCSSPATPWSGRWPARVVVATAIGVLGVRERERDSAIGVILAFGLGVGVYLLSLYHGFATEATNILFGQIFGVSNGQLSSSSPSRSAVLVAMAVLYRPLLFASRRSRGGGGPRRARAPGRAPLSLRPRAHGDRGRADRRHAAGAQPRDHAGCRGAAPVRAARRWSPACRSPSRSLACDGGLLASLQSSTVKASVFVTAFSFGIYVVARVVGGALHLGRPSSRQRWWQRGEWV